MFMKIAMNKGINTLTVTDEELFIITDALEAWEEDTHQADLYNELIEAMTFTEDNIPDEEDGFSCADFETSLDCMMWANGVQ